MRTTRMMRGAMSDFLIAKMLFEEDELEEKNRKMATESDFLLAQSLREGEAIEEERAENESYEMLLERWKRRVGQERIEIVVEKVGRRCARAGFEYAE